MATFQFFSITLPESTHLDSLLTWERRAFLRSVRRGELLLGELKRPATIKRVQTLLLSAFKFRNLTFSEERTCGWVRGLTKEEYEKAVQAVQAAQEGHAGTKDLARPPQFLALAKDLVHFCCPQRSEALPFTQTAYVRPGQTELEPLPKQWPVKPPAKRVRTTIVEGPGPAELEPLPKQTPQKKKPRVAAASLERRSELVRELLEEVVDVSTCRRHAVLKGIPPLPRLDLPLSQVASNPEADIGHSDPVLKAHLGDEELLVDPSFAAVVEHVVLQETPAPFSAQKPLFANRLY
jgi:hypothetical protein